MEIDERYNVNNDEEKYKKFILFKAIIVVILISILVYFHIYLKEESLIKEGECYNDKLFNWTQNLNTYFLINKHERNQIIIISSFLVDCLILLTAINWVFFWHDNVLLLATFLFYFVRTAIFLNLFQMQFPDGYNFEDPGLPSLTVGYLLTNDFFYSGHVGFPILFALEYWRKRSYYMIIPCLLVCSFEIITMVLLRGHFFIDLLFGVIFAHYFYKVSLLINAFLENYISTCFKDEELKEFEIPLIEVNDEQNENKREYN